MLLDKAAFERSISNVVGANSLYFEKVRCTWHSFRTLFAGQALTVLIHGHRPRPTANLSGVSGARRVADGVTAAGVVAVHIEVGRSVAAEALVAFQRKRATRRGGDEMRERGGNQRDNTLPASAQTRATHSIPCKYHRRSTKVHRLVGWERNTQESRQVCSKPHVCRTTKGRRQAAKNDKQENSGTPGLITSLPFWVPKYTNPVQRMPHVCCVHSADATKDANVGVMHRAMAYARNGGIG